MSRCDAVKAITLSIHANPLSRLLVLLFPVPAGGMRPYCRRCIYIVGNRSLQPQVMDLLNDMGLEPKLMHNNEGCFVIQSDALQAYIAR